MISKILVKSYPILNKSAHCGYSRVHATMEQQNPQIYTDKERKSQLKFDSVRLKRVQNMSQERSLTCVDSLVFIQIMYACTSDNHFMCCFFSIQTV